MQPQQDVTAPLPGHGPNPPQGHRGMGHMHFGPQHIGHGGHVQGQFPPQLQQALNNHLQALNQQIATQMASHAGTLLQAQVNATQVHGPQHPQMPQQSFQQVVAQQQQARAAAGQQGVAGSAPVQLNRDNTATPPPQTTTTSATPISQPLRSSTPTNVNTVVRENQGSNGESWRMVIQSTSTVTAPHPNLPRVPTPVSMGFQGQANIPVGAIANPQHGLAQTPEQLQMRIVDQELLSIQSAVARGIAPPISVFENVRTILRNVETAEGAMHLRSRLDHLSMQADQQRMSLNNTLMRVLSEQQATTLSTQRGGSGVSQNRSTEQSSVYLLSSPSGPQALLVSPWGTYTAPWHAPMLAGSGIPLIMQQHGHLPPTPHVPGMHATTTAPQNPPANNAPPQPQQQQGQQANDARDLLRLIIPFGGHIWLLIRLFGFVYFFTAGGGSRRAVLLGAFAFLVFIAQTGIFRPLVRGVWEPIRHHVEGLLPIPGNEPAAPVRGAGGTQNPPTPIAEGGAAPRDRQPTPQDAAARLLQEREQRDTGVVREQIRRIERAVALFVGSLVPGFGERHIAARDAAEAIRQAELRQREETARRQEEERNAQSSGEGNNGDMQPNPGQEQPQAGQPPLIEI